MAEPLNVEMERALEQVRAVVRTLPEAVEQEGVTPPCFLVDDQPFARFVESESSAAPRLALLAGDDVDAFCAGAPDQLTPLPSLGADWAAITLDGAADWTLVADRVAHSWELAAPRRLLEAGGR